MFDDIMSITRSCIIGIQDNVDSPGIFLIKQLIAIEAFNIDVFCFDKFHTILKSELNINLDRLSFHDCSPAIPIDYSNVECNNHTESDCLENFVNSLKKTQPAKTVIVIDSLSTMLLIYPLEKVYRILRSLLIDSSLKNTIIHVYAMIHDDTVVDAYKTLKILRHRLCRVWAQVKSDHIVLSNRSRSGKVTTTIYDYSINGQGFICIIKRKSTRNNEEKTDTENVASTFKLTLSESERKARDAVVLPYERNEPNKNPKGGNIYYQQDENDDWDEEDPDNDLEFT